MLDALNALVTLAFTGDPIQLNLDRAALESMTRTESLDFLFFIFFYAFYVVMSMILLLNLLIAMMGETFAQVSSAWRAAGN